MIQLCLSKLSPNITNHNRVSSSSLSVLPLFSLSLRVHSFILLLDYNTQNHLTALFFPQSLNLGPINETPELSLPTSCPSSPPGAGPCHFLARLPNSFSSTSPSQLSTSQPDIFLKATSAHINYNISFTLWLKISSLWLSIDNKMKLKTPYLLSSTVQYNLTLQPLLQPQFHFLNTPGISYLFTV